MPRSLVSVRIACLAFLLIGAIGCNTYPYYTQEGSNESRTVVVHVKKDQKITVPTSTAIGGGLSDAAIPGVSSDEIVIEKEKAKVTVTMKGPMVFVKKVEYDGKPVKLKSDL